jgi:hypothetical protein
MDIVSIRKLNMLLQLAHADRHFDDSERDLIRRIALQKSIPASVIDEMLLHPISVDSLGALSEDQKMDYLLTAVELILVDGVLTPVRCVSPRAWPSSWDSEFKWLNSLPGPSVKRHGRSSSGWSIPNTWPPE